MSLEPQHQFSKNDKRGSWKHDCNWCNKPELHRIHKTPEQEAAEFVAMMANCRKS